MQLFLVFIKESIAFDMVHLNMPRIQRFFFLSVAGINLSTYSYSQGVIGASCFVGEVEHGSRTKSRCTGLTSHPPALSKASRDWGCWGQSKSTVCARSGHHGTSAAHLYSPNQQQTWLRMAEWHQSQNAALVGSGGRATA